MSKSVAVAVVLCIFLLLAVARAFVVQQQHVNVARSMTRTMRQMHYTPLAALMDKHNQQDVDDKTPADVSSATIARRQERQSIERRDLLLASLVATTSTLLLSSSSPALAAQQDDKDKIAKGYQQLNYLLENWEKETTICKTGYDRGCERTPLKVMEYLGYKSIDAPLFKVEKTLMRLSSSVPEGYDGQYQDAMETIIEKADEGSGMAYVSSWGEANPGGGKDRVEYFIERSKDNVIVVRDNLKTILKILDIKV